MTSRHESTAITSLNRKGGVGKTHFCWLTASAALARGQRVLLVDLDPQANLTSSFLAENEFPLSVETLFSAAHEPDARPLIRSTRFEGIDLIPSSARLEPVNVSEGWEAADLHFSLAEALAPVRDNYDFILFDCPPSLSLVSYAALCASDSVVIPLEAAQ